MWIFKRHRHLKKELLSGYLDQRLSSGERERVSRGLAACATCREELAGWRNTLAVLQGLEDVPAPRSFTLAGPPPAPVAAPPPLPLRAPRWVYAGAASMAGLALAVMVSLEAAGLAPPELVQTGPESASFAATPEWSPQQGIVADSAEPEAPTPPEADTMRAAEAPAEAEGPEVARALPPEDSDGAPTFTPAPFALEATPGPEPTATPAPAMPGETSGPAGPPGPAGPMGPSGAGSGPTGPTGPDEEAPTADPVPAFDHLALSQAEGTPLLWRILQGTAAALLVVLLGALVLKRRSRRRSAAN